MAGHVLKLITSTKLLYKTLEMFCRQEEIYLKNTVLNEFSCSAVFDSFGDFVGFAVDLKETKTSTSGCFSFNVQLPALFIFYW